ncbi:MAG: hypothetical protein PHD15_05630 [Clostridia bacterium]|nr:hypothetical protein [Clostridia bacterium]MDD4387214.1 hypothetical protein [Clostridia bacterium]
MKKFLIVFLICFLAIFATFIITNYNVNSVIIAENVNILLNKIIGKSDLEYSDELKVNKLQIKNATYSYNKLNNYQKKMYTAVAYGVKDLKSTVNVDNYSSGDVDIISKDAKVAMTAFFADHPEVFYLNLAYKLSVSTGLMYDKIEIELSYSVKNKQDLNKKLQEIENAIISYTYNLYTKSDFEKELIIHDNIVKDVKYYNETTEISNVPEVYHTIYGVLIEKQAVCDGFAKTMQILLDRCNIENIFITGNINETPHAWNMVRLDSEWYHLDLTSDKYVKEADGTNKTVAHTYFNVTDEFILKSHGIDDQESNPIAQSTNYNYYIKTNTYIYSTQNFGNRIKEIIQFQSNSNSLEFSTDINDVPTKLLSVLYDINFNGYKNNDGTIKMKYYNENNTYIVQKR